MFNRISTGPLTRLSRPARGLFPSQLLPYFLLAACIAFLGTMLPQSSFASSRTLSSPLSSRTSSPLRSTTTRSTTTPRIALSPEAALAKTADQLFAERVDAESALRSLISTHRVSLATAEVALDRNLSGSCCA